MTSPADTQDVPLASVTSFGPSEALAFVGFLASVLMTVFGNDFGITRHAESIAAIGVWVLPAAMAFARAIKHHGVAQANATVIASQQAAQTPPLALGVDLDDIEVDSGEPVEQPPTGFPTDDADAPVGAPRGPRSL